MSGIQIMTVFRGIRLSDCSLTLIVIQFCPVFRSDSFDYRRKKSSKAPAKKSPVKGRKGKKDASEEEGEIASDDKEFDDGLDDDLIGTSY